jgi:hypothetical protein
MGFMTDAKIAAWQEANGIEETTGERGKILEALSGTAFKMIKIAEQEKCGIRDGGFDEVGGMIIELCERLLEMRMGVSTSQLQEARSRIKPAESGKRLELLSIMQEVCFDTIKIIELERSGIRDGDGYWRGSDPMGARASGLIYDVMELLSQPYTGLEPGKKPIARPSWTD